MLHIEPKDITVQEAFRFLLGGIAPRPIALVSTLSKNGIRNLTPFSFFNAFGGNPPTIAFSPSRRQRDGSLKDTYRNLVDTGECVVQAVTYSMVQQVSLASTEYPPEVDEFIKSGLTPIASDIVKPPRVKESPFQMECKVKQIISLGDGGGSGNLTLCEVLKFHIAEDIFKDGEIHPDLIDLVGRNSGDFYTRASGQAIFEVEKPLRKTGIGYDNLPDFIKRSQVYTANNLGQLANVERLPTADEATKFLDSLEEVEASEEVFHRYIQRFDYRKALAVAMALAKEYPERARTFVEVSVRCALEKNDVDFAWKAAMLAADMK